MKRLNLIEENNGCQYLYRFCQNGKMIVYRGPHVDHHQIVAVFSKQPPIVTKWPDGSYTEHRKTRDIVLTINPPY
jgi:hypothetical protein